MIIPHHQQQRSSHKTFPDKHNQKNTITHNKKNSINYRKIVLHDSKNDITSDPFLYIHTPFLNWPQTPLLFFINLPQRSLFLPFKTLVFLTPKPKNLDFYALLIALPIISVSNILTFLSLSGHPTYKFTFLQHSTLGFLFWVLLVLIIIKESFDLSMIYEGFVYVFAGVCFFVEYFINGNEFSGVTSNAYGLFGELTLVCAFSCLFLSVKPTAFLADFCLSSGLIFKGTWFLQVGLNLYTEVFRLKGCHLVLSLSPDRDEVDVKCDLDEDSLRGVVLMNMLFVWHAIVVLIICFGLFGLLSCKEGLRCGEGNGPLLARIESHSLLMQPLPDLEMA